MIKTINHLRHPELPLFAINITSRVQTISVTERLLILSPVCLALDTFSALIPQVSKYLQLPAESTTYACKILHDTSRNTREFRESDTQHAPRNTHHLSLSPI